MSWPNSNPKSSIKSNRELPSTEVSDGFFRISPDKARAEDLFTLAKERLELVKIFPNSRPHLIIEAYYEIIKELLTAIMYIDGYKTLSHVQLIDYFSDNYEGEWRGLINELRKHRINIVYNGKRISGEFLVNHEDRINEMIIQLLKLVEGKLVEKI